MGGLWCIIKKEQFKISAGIRPKEVDILSRCSIFLSFKSVLDVFITPRIYDVIGGIIKKERFKILSAFRP